MPCTSRAPWDGAHIFMFLQTHASGGRQNGQDSRPGQFERRIELSQHTPANICAEKCCRVHYLHSESLGLSTKEAGRRPVACAGWVRTRSCAPVARRWSLRFTRMILLLFYIILFAFSLYCTVRLVKKTGSPGVLAVLSFVPVLNILVWLMFVFCEWPIEKELRKYRKLYGVLEDNPADDIMDTEADCLECGASIPVGTPICPSCGWSYQAETEM